MHAPQPGGEYYVNKTLIMNPYDHRMRAYADSMASVCRWKSIQNPHPNLDVLAIQWLTSDDTWRLCGLNLQNLKLVMSAIQILVKDALTLAWNGAGGVAVGGATIMDQLSSAVSQAGKISKEKEGAAMRILNGILQMLGIHIIPGQSFTLAFIQFVFRSLNFALNRSVRMALS